MTPSRPPKPHTFPHTEERADRTREAGAGRRPLEAAYALREGLLRRQRAERRLLLSTSERAVFANANEYAEAVDGLVAALAAFRDFGLAPDAASDDIRRAIDTEASS